MNDQLMTIKFPAVAQVRCDGENPKDRIGVRKPPLHLIPPTAEILESAVMALGAKKYGPFNWRTANVKASVYVAAARRHLVQWFDGQDDDAESGVSHSVHARACLGILLDALATGHLVDDRPVPGAGAELIEQLTATPEEQKMIYLASPYTHPDERVRHWRFREVCRAAAALLRAGVTVFSPIAHSHPIARFGMPTSWEFWSQVDREYLSRCDVLAVLTLPGWRESIGLQAEIQLAGEMGIPIVYVSPTEVGADDRDPPTLDELAQRPSPLKQRAA